MDDLKLFQEGSPLTNEQAGQVWSRLSQRYAQEASGNTVGFVKGPRAGSIFNTVEYKTLKEKNITNIFTGIFQ